MVFRVVTDGKPRHFSDRTPTRSWEIADVSVAKLEVSRYLSVRETSPDDASAQWVKLA